MLLGGGMESRIVRAGAIEKTSPASPNLEMSSGEHVLMLLCLECLAQEICFVLNALSKKSGPKVISDRMK